MAVNSECWGAMSAVRMTLNASPEVQARMWNAAKVWLEQERKRAGK